MIRQGLFEILQNQPLTHDVYKLVLGGDTSAFQAPGQFANIRLQGLYLRRPISVCAWDEKTLTLLYKVVGKGTMQLAQMQPGETLDLLTGLGNGFNPAHARGKRIALVGGGVGVPPLYGLMQQLAGEEVACLLGFQSARDVFYKEEFAALGAKVQVATVDGTLGTQGFVTDVLKTLQYDYYFTCGPEPMLRAVHALGKEGQLSFEERMGCGFGACMGCSCKTLTGYKRICVEGPVMHSAEVML